jgi:hypothetical protein
MKDQNLKKISLSEIVKDCYNEIKEKNFREKTQSNNRYIKIYQILSSEKDIKHLSKGCIPYFYKNHSFLSFHESVIDIMENHKNSNFQYISVMPIEATKDIKYEISAKNILDKTRKHFDWDLYSLQNITLNKPIETNKAIMYPGKNLIKKAGIEVLNKLAKEKLIKKDTIECWTKPSRINIFNSLWVIRTKLFKDYVENLLKPTIEILNNETIESILIKESLATPKLTQQNKKVKTPPAAFILQQLINIYAIDRNLLNAEVF